MHLRDKRIIEIVSNDKRRLLRRSDDWSGSRGAGLAREQALVGAVAKLPKLEPHPKGRDEKNGEEDLLVSGNHGWRAPVRLGSERHSRTAAASALAT